MSKFTDTDKKIKCEKCNNGCVTTTDTGGMVRLGCVAVNGIIWHDPSQCVCDCHSTNYSDTDKYKDSDKRFDKAFGDGIFGIGLVDPECIKSFLHQEIERKENNLIGNFIEQLLYIQITPDLEMTVQRLLKDYRKKLDKTK